MQTRFGQVQDHLSTQTAAQTLPENGNITTAKEIPYDYVATFTLEGRRGNRVQDVINISVEGAFVAVAIGYSFIPARLPDLTDQEKIATRSRLDAVSRVVVGRQGRAQTITDLILDPRTLLRCLLVRFCGINFKYSIIDSATGRELQNQPIHNIAGLGESSGERPFRLMPKPIRFEPRSTIRIEVEEISEGPIFGYDDSTGRRIGAELFIVLHGYKMLGVGA